MSNPEELEAQKSAFEEAVKAVDTGNPTSEQVELVLGAETEEIDEDNQVDLDEEGLDEDVDDLIIVKKPVVEEQVIPVDQEPIVIIEPKNDIGAKYAETANELNTAKQKLKNAEIHEERLKTDPIYRRDYLKRLGIEEPIARKDIDLSGVDIHDEEFLRGIEVNKLSLEEVRAEIASLKEDNRQLKAEKVAETEISQAEAKVNSEIEQITKLQSEVPEIKLDGDFLKVHTEYKEWHERVGATNAEKYMSDEAFRKSVDKQGHKCPVEMEQFNKLSTIYDIYEKYNKEGYNSIKDAFKCSDHFDRINNTRKENVLQDGDSLIEAKLKEREQQSIVLDGTTAKDNFEPSSTVTEDEMVEILDKDPRLLTEREAKIRTQFMDKHCTIDE
jgi:hypothetical protein